MEKEDNIILSVKGITKKFGGIIALNNVNFDIYKGEIVSLVGDNGAGKSTLIKIISGNFPPDSGEIYFEGKRINLKSPNDARLLGIETVYQDLSLCNNLDVVFNLFVGREDTKKILGFNFLRRGKMEEETLKIISEVGIDIPKISERVEYLSGGQRQAIATGRFVKWGKRLGLLDEPMAATGVRETGKILELIKAIKKKGITIIFITHNLQHAFKVSDRIIVLRHGELVGIKETKLTDPDEIVSMITGSIFIKQSKIC
jgi:D-xylose transport system ATP-binding protein